MSRECLGRLHTLPVQSATGRRGGAIHSFTLDEGSFCDEVTEAMAWLAETGVATEHKSAYDHLLDRIASVDYGESRPYALPHPDPTPQNFILTHIRDQRQSDCSSPF